MAKLTFLGTGSLEGIPSPLCTCNTCNSARKGTKDARLRSSMLIEFDDGESLIIDCTPDFRTQVEKFKPEIKNLFISHGHFDHFFGLGELSYLIPLFNINLTVHAAKDVINYCKTIFPFIKINYKEVNDVLIIGKNKLELIPVYHAKNTTTHGLLFNTVAIIPEVYKIDEKTKAWLKSKKVHTLICDAAYYDKAVFNDHFTIFDAINLGKELDVQKTIVTNIWHKNPKHSELTKRHPEIIVAFDGLEIEI